MEIVTGNSHAGFVADTVRGGRPASTALDTQVVDSWKRCVRDFALDPDRRPEPIVLERSDVLRVECTWDRSLAPMPEPRYITWNEGTADEMCYSTVSTIRP